MNVDDFHRPVHEGFSTSSVKENSIAIDDNDEQLQRFKPQPTSVLISPFEVETEIIPGVFHAVFLRRLECIHAADATDVLHVDGDSVLNKKRTPRIRVISSRAYYYCLLFNRPRFYE
ncbi:hypothetical protein RB195_012892 [Necator americanus]|uniref:Uncharacterized protein n=1 Tax=Necator americanus TaxID=51031 RepID=A0ABR1DT17_NECAM